MYRWPITPTLLAKLKICLFGTILVLNLNKLVQGLEGNDLKMNKNLSVSWHHPSASSPTLLLSYPYNSTDHNSSDLIVTTNYLPSQEAIPLKLIAEVHPKQDINLEAYLDTSPSYESHLQRSSIIYGLSKVAEKAEVSPHLSEQCQRHFRQIQRGMQRKEPWAMKVLDASGTRPSGFVVGQNFWLGSREACDASNRPLSITLSPQFPRQMHLGIVRDAAPIEMNYRVVYMKHNSPWQVHIEMIAEQILHVGLCLPAACSNSEVLHLMSAYNEQDLFADNEIYNIKAELLYIKDLQLNEEFYQRFSYRFLITFVPFVVLMTLLAINLHSKQQQQQEPLSETEGATKLATKSLASRFSQSLQSYILCFDVQNNWSKLFTLEESNGRGEVPVINGLRTISALFVLIFHVFWYMYFTVNNRPFLVSQVETGIFRYFSSAPIFVDAFFAISGFLHVHNFLQNAKKIQTIRQNNLRQNAKEFFKMLFHRYLRLGPLYLVVLSVVDLLHAYLEQVSVYHITDRFDRSCSKFWWRNLLFIHNLFELEDMCVNWTWSLACEMQFFIITTILLMLYVKQPKLVKSLVFAGFLANIFWSYFIALSINFELSVETFFATAKHIYLSPYVRSLTYILGAIAGWYLLEQHRQHHKHPVSDSESDSDSSAEIKIPRAASVFCLSRLKEHFYWNIAIVSIFICVFLSYSRDKSHLSAISLIVFGRLAFGLAICWTIMASAMGKVSWWSQILEYSIFKHLNRLTYAIYLINPFLITFIYGQTTASIHAEPLLICVFCLGLMVLVYVFSVVFSLAFEVPFCNWSALMLGRRIHPLKTKTN